MQEHTTGGTVKPRKVLLYDKINGTAMQIHAVHLDLDPLAKLQPLLAAFADQRVGCLVLFVIVVGEVAHVHHPLNGKINHSHIDTIIGRA